MLIDWPQSFNDFWDRLEDKANRGNSRARKELDLLLAELAVLADLDVAPATDSATLKRVRQSRQYQVWRVAHPYETDVAMRLIVWFPPDDHGRIVVALFAGNKAQMGDVFYNSVGARADATIDQWLHHQRRQGKGEQ